MKKLILVLFLVGGVIQAGIAQYSARPSVLNFNTSCSVYSFDIFAKRTNTTGSILVGTSSFYLNYDMGALSTPTLSNVNAKYTGPSDHSGDYDPMTVQIVRGKIAVTILFTGNSTGPGSALAYPDSERICTVSLTITNPSQNASLTWDELNSAITTLNFQPVTHSFYGGDTNPIRPAGLTSVKETSPIAFALMQNYPNPFNPESEIKFSVEKSGRATLQVFNVAGQLVATLFDGVAEAGQYYHIRFGSSHLASGVYFYRLQSFNKTDVKKMLLMR